MEGYHRLDEYARQARDERIISLVESGVEHKDIALMVHLTPAGFATRLQKLRQDGKFTPVGACK